MSPHKEDTYRDGFKKVPFCSVCGVEYPEGNCPGTFQAEIVGNAEKEKIELTGETKLHK